MEENKVKYQHWTKEEMALLAHLMSTAFNAGKNQSEAAEFASSKLGRSKLACLGQYQAKMRNKPLSIWSLLPEPGEPEWEIETPADLGSDTDIDKEPNYEEKPSFVDDLMKQMRNGDGYISMFADAEIQEPIKITVHDGETTAEAEILIDKNDVVIAKVKGLIITIEL
jgi:hypothetical protein